MDTGKDGGELLRYFKEMGPQGDEQLRVIYANAYERARAGASVGVLFEEIYREPLRRVIGDERYEIAKGVFDEYKEVPYGDLLERITATEARVKNLKMQDKKEEVEKLEKELGKMQKIAYVIEKLEERRILDPVKETNLQLISFFEPEKEELAEAA